LAVTNGFLPQGERDNNPYQLHRSGWSVSEMQDRGYRTIGVTGWKPLFGDYATVRFRPTWLWTRVAVITRPVFERWPSQAFQILCVKELRCRALAGGDRRYRRDSADPKKCSTRTRTSVGSRSLAFAGSAAPCFTGVPR
jgi:hypothetical protein